MTYEFQVTYSFDVLLAHRRLHAKLFYPTKILLRRGFFFLGGLLLVVLSIRALPYRWLLNGLIGVYGILCIVYALLFYYYHTWRHCRAIRKSGLEPVCTVTLDDTGVHERGPISDTFYPYDGFADIIFCRNIYFLFLRNSGNPVIIPETAIPADVLKQFQEFIQEKTGKLISYVRV